MDITPLAHNFLNMPYPFLPFSLIELIETLASVAACISALIALYAVWEIKKQRQSSYKPDLFLAISSSVQAVIKQDPEYPEHEPGIQYRQYNNDKQEDLLFVHYSIENIGFGAAKNVKIVWQFDFPQAFRKIKDLSSTEYKVLSEDYYLTICNHAGEVFCSSWISWEDIEPTHYDFVLPRAQERFELGAFIPSEITDLFVAYALLRMNIINDDYLNLIYREEFEDFPSLLATITYKDIGNQSFTKHFSINFTISSGIHDLGQRFSDLEEIVLNIHKVIRQL